MDKKPSKPSNPSNPESKGFVVRDQRFWLNDDDDGAAGNGNAEPKPPNFVEDLQQQLAEKDKTLRDYIQAHKSSVSDMGDVRTRLERELERRVQLELAKLIEPFLEVLENLERLKASCQQGADHAAMEQGIALLLSKFNELLKTRGVTLIKTKDQKFDPNTMEALMTTPGSLDQEGMVLEELRPGYLLGNLVVRPAGVRVSVNK